MSVIAAGGVRLLPTRAAVPAGFSRRRVILLRVIVGVLILGAWEGASVLRVIEPHLLGSPTGIAKRFVEMIAGERVYGRTIYDHIWSTLQVILVGYSVGAIVGIAAGFALGRTQRLGRVLEPIVLAVAAIPKIAIAPLFILLLGIGAASRIAIVFIEVFFMVFFNTLRGVQEVNEEYVHLARIMGASRLATARRVILPAAAPSIMVGLRMGVPYAMIGAILGEYIASNQGLGWLLLYTAADFDPDGLWATLIFLVVTTLLLGRVLQLIERRVLAWRPRSGAEAHAAA